MVTAKRIAVVGVSASGKSHVARLLAEKLSLPLTSTDSIMWKPGWEYVGDETASEALKETADRDEWIIEGYIPKPVRALVLSRADLVLHLDYPRHVAAWRYVKRWLRHRTDPRPELAGCPEKFDLKFLKLVWTKREGVSLKRYLDEVTPAEKVVRLTTPRKTQEYVRGL